MKKSDLTKLIAIGAAVTAAEDFPHLRQHFILCVTAVSLRRIFIYLQTVLATAATTKQALSAVAEKL